jgi:hypothetical protein
VAKNKDPVQINTLTLDRTMLFLKLFKGMLKKCLRTTAVGIFDWV